ncbi:MAG TPA: CbtB domain-containing protein [Afifellaceae bacterium]|nr:CbtB domain-containing protein [Afifellaceae bacterium]
MTTSARTLPAAAAGSRPIAAFAAIVFGLVLVGGAGFVQAESLHAAAHDTRHAFGLPCH